MAHLASLRSVVSPETDNQKIRSYPACLCLLGATPGGASPDQLPKVAEALNVSVEDLVGTNGKKKRGAGPTGKMRQLFEAASRLPRSQQQKIAAVLEAFIAHNQGA